MSIVVAIDPQMSALRRDRPVVGAKVLHHDEFARVARMVVPEHIKHETPDQEGEWTVGLPDSILPHLSSGIGMRSNRPHDYVMHMWRGHMTAFLKRACALPVIGCTVYVLDRAAYLRECAESDGFPHALESNTQTTHIVTGITVHTDASQTWVSRPLDLLHQIARTKDLTTEVMERFRIRAATSSTFWNQFCEVSD